MPQSLLLCIGAGVFVFFFFVFTRTDLRPTDRSIDGRRAGDAAGGLVILRGMAKVGVSPGEHSLAATMEAFALAEDIDGVLSLVQVGVLP